MNEGSFPFDWLLFIGSIYIYIYICHPIGHVSTGILNYGGRLSNIYNMIPFPTLLGVCYDCLPSIQSWLFILFLDSFICQFKVPIAFA